MRTLINFLTPKICIQQSPCVQYKSLFPCFLCIFFADWILKYSIQAKNIMLLGHGLIHRLHAKMDRQKILVLPFY